jgi:hypothetical protein
VAKPPAIVAVIAMALVTGCGAGGSDTPGGGALPSRPQELTLDRVDPCVLLTNEQRQRLGLNRIHRPSAPPDAKTCQFTHFPGEPDEGYDVGAYVREAAAPALASPGSRIVNVARFGAVEARAIRGDPERACFVYVDVAEGQHLRVLYSYDGRELPMNRQVACEKARSVAELMVQNLIAQRR